MGIALAHRLGFGEKEMIEFGTGAMLRDIGMSRVDNAICENPGKLTVSEFEQMKLHTQNSEDILQETGGLSEVTRSIIRHHHEKLDGSGYPDGLKGQEIPSMVRLCTIVDIFDALTTQRIYQRALGSYEALQLMNREMRDEIDTDIFRAFISMMGTNT